MKFPTGAASDRRGVDRVRREGSSWLLARGALALSWATSSLWRVSLCEAARGAAAFAFGKLVSVTSGKTRFQGH